MAAVFQATGLASGLNTGSIVDAMVQSESQNLTQMKSQQTAYQTQISTLADLTSKLATLQSTAESLGTSGVVGLATQSSNSSFTAIPTASAIAGRYSVQVDRLAQAAKSLSQPFASSDAMVKGGTLQFTVMGKTYSRLTVTDGESLANVANDINGLGAPISAVVLNDGSQSYLSITNTTTGTPLTGGDALSVVETSTGSKGQALDLNLIQDAQNAQVEVDGLTFTRQSNSISDAIPGTTLQLNSEETTPETLVMASDSSATQSKLQTFVDAYNAVIKVVQKQLDVTETTDRTTSLVGDNAIRDLQSQLQGLVSHMGTGSDVRSLADLGVKTAQDGSLSIDSSVLSSALARNPTAVNALFSDTTNGLSTLTSALVQTETDPLNGILTVDSQWLNNRVSSLQDDQTAEQTRIDNYRTQLVAQFTAMEQVISELKSSASYLNQLFGTSSSSSSSSGSSSS